ncbi:MAG: FAD-dependent oxidoreductase [Candidatus Aenigmatarchaeota archaeon]
MEKDIVPYDCIIVGAGPAGITAAIYLARKKLDILLITLDIGGQANLSTDVENYTGFTMIPGQELVKRFEEHLEAFKIRYVCDKVEEVRKEKDLFKVKTKTKVYWSKTVIIASGKKPRSLKVPGEDEFIGKGVIYGTTFDLPFFKDKPLAIVGGGNSALQAVLEASKFTKKIFLINIASDLTGDEILKEQVKKLSFVKIFNNSRVKAIKGKNRVESIEVENLVSKEVLNLNVEGVIVVIGLEPSLDFKLPRGLKLNKNREIDVDQNCKTNIAGLFAAGDVTDVKWKQIIVAAGEGAKAALSAHEYLQRKFLIEYY